MKRIIAVCLLVIGVCLAANAQKKREITTPVTVNYCLPKVAYRVDVQLECNHRVPGPFCATAQSDLGVKPEITEAEDCWKITGIDVSPYYLPDENATFTTSASVDYHPIMLSLSPEGFLAGVAAIPGRECPDKCASWSYVPEEKSTEKEVSVASVKAYNPLKEVLDSNYTEEEIDGVMKRIWDPIVSYAPKELADARSEAVKEIFRIRTERTRLLASENNVPDGASLKRILKEFDRMEEGYLSLFLGKESISRTTRSFTVLPGKEKEMVVAFRFNREHGIAQKNDVSVPAYGLRVDALTLPADAAAGGADALGSSAVRYRVPATATISLVRVNETLRSFTDVVPQLGVVRTFPLEVVGNEGLALEFHPQYGSLKSVYKRP